MSAKSSKKSSNRDRQPEWWTVGSPCAIVVAMLLLSAILRPSTDGSPTAVRAAEANSSTRIDLEQRADADRSRIATTPDQWTLQFVMMCDESNLQPLVQVLEGDDAFFLLRYPDPERSCYRVCWGRYDSKQEAQRPQIYPSALRAVEQTPWATPISAVLP